jgi:hypothetical protein
MATGVASNDEIVLRPSKRKWLGVMSIGLVFVASGIFMIVDRGGVFSWLTTIFFAGCAVVAIIQLFSNSYLRLYATGFEQNMMGRKRNYQWTDVSDFRTAWRGTSLVRKIAPGSSALGDTFGMSAIELADLMNSYRNKSIAE